MLYNIRLDRLKRAQVESWDGRVIKATPAFWWAVGKDVEMVIGWLDARYIDWSVTHDGKRMPSLSETPTDSQIAKKVIP